MYIYARKRKFARKVMTLTKCIATRPVPAFQGQSDGGGLRRPYEILGEGKFRTLSICETTFLLSFII